MFHRKFISNRNEKKQITMNKTVYLALSVLDLSKNVLYEFWYDYVNPKHGENAKLCYMDTDSFIVHVKLDDIYKDIAEDAETGFDTSNIEIDRSLSKGKNKNLIGLTKDELGGQIMKEFVRLRAKTYSYLKDSNDEDKKTKRTKKCVIKRKLKFQDYKNCLEAAQMERKINYLRKKKIDIDSLTEDQKEFVNNKIILRTQRHNVFTEVINKIALSSNDDKRMQSIDSIETYAYGTSKDLIRMK